MYQFVQPGRLNPKSFPRVTHNAGLGRVRWLAVVVEVEVVEESAEADGKQVWLLKGGEVADTVVLGPAHEGIHVLWWH